jgi:hypothetical protein
MALAFEVIDDEAAEGAVERARLRVSGEQEDIHGEAGLVGMGNRLPILKTRPVNWKWIAWIRGIDMAYTSPGRTNRFDRLDLNLLLTLDVLLKELNVIRAAERLHLSQPSVSAQLARLREHFGDPLLLPGPRGMKPTARALHHWEMRWPCWPMPWRQRRASMPRRPRTPGASLLPITARWPCWRP